MQTKFWVALFFTRKTLGILHKTLTLNMVQSMVLKCVLFTFFNLNAFAINHITRSITEH